MSHDRCYEHKCRACRKCAEVDEADVAWFAVEEICAGHDDIARLRAENERLRTESVPFVRGWVQHDDGSRSIVQRWVRRDDAPAGEWVSLDQPRSTTHDLMMEVD